MARARIDGKETAVIPHCPPVAPSLRSAARQRTCVVLPPSLKGLKRAYRQHRLHLRPSHWEGPGPPLTSPTSRRPSPYRCPPVAPSLRSAARQRTCAVLTPSLKDLKRAYRQHRLHPRLNYCLGPGTRSCGALPPPRRQPLAGLSL